MRFEILLLGALLAISSCGSDKSSSSSAISTSPLVGNWATGCIDNTDVGSMQKKSLAITSSKITFTVHVFSDSDCTQETMKAIQVSSYTLSSGKNIDKKIISEQLFLEDATLVQDFNTSSGYGYTNWELNTPKEIAGKSVAAGESSETAINAILYNIYQLKDGKLSFGDITQSYDGTTPDKRPQSFNTVSVYTRP